MIVTVLVGVVMRETPCKGLVETVLDSDRCWVDWVAAGCCCLEAWAVGHWCRKGVGFVLALEPHGASRRKAMRR